MSSDGQGYRLCRSKKERAAREAIFHAGKYAFAHRRDKKTIFASFGTFASSGLDTMEARLLMERSLILSPHRRDEQIEGHYK